MAQNQRESTLQTVYSFLNPGWFREIFAEEAWNSDLNRFEQKNEQDAKSNTFRFSDWSKCTQRWNQLPTAPLSEERVFTQCTGQERIRTALGTCEIDGNAWKNFVPESDTMTQCGEIWRTMTQRYASHILESIQVAGLLRWSHHRFSAASLAA